MRSLQGIERQFEANLMSLRKIRGSILDVKDTSWHETYSTYKAKCVNCGCYGAFACFFFPQPHLPLPLKDSRPGGDGAERHLLGL